MESSVPHIHHFVPQFVLRNFRDSTGKVWVYDTEKRTIEARGTKRVAAVEDLYAWAKSDGSTDYATIEDFFSRLIENDAALAVQKLLTRKFLSDEEARHFFNFVSAQHCRTPNFFARLSESMAPTLQESLERMAKYDKGFRSRLTKSLSVSGASAAEIEALLAQAGAGEIKIAPDPQFVLQQGLKLIQPLAEEISRMRWCFFDVPSADPDLVIGDHPLTLFDADPLSDGQRPIGIGSPYVEIALPLSPRMAAIGRWDGPVSYGELETGAVAVVNRRTIRAAQRFVYATNKSECLMRQALVAKADAPKVRVQRTTCGEGLVISTSYY